MKTAYETYWLGLELSHRALVRNLSRFITAADRRETNAELGPFVELYVEFLGVHHDSEDRFVFPALRRHTAGRTTDIAHLDRWDREHHDLYRLAAELASLAKRLPASLAELGARSQALVAVLEPHVRDEESVLTAGHLAEMIPERELADTLGQIAKANRPRALAMASFLATSLEPAEQHALMGDAPWVFRKVLLPIVGRRKMRRFRGLVHTNEIAP